MRTKTAEHRVLIPTWFQRPINTLAYYGVEAGSRAELPSQFKFKAVVVGGGGVFPIWSTGSQARHPPLHQSPSLLPADSTDS